MNKELKELEIILSDFKCNKNCPYCTAKITKWPLVEDNLDMLELKAEELRKLGYSFHYLTIGGNGEPTLHSVEKLKRIIDIFKDFDIPIKRVLTSGNIFNIDEQEKFDLLNNAGYVFELTVASFNTELDSRTLGYTNDYFKAENFKKAKRIRINYVMLKQNIDTYLYEIREFIKKYPNVETVAIKLLNVNTKNGKVDNSYSEWIVNNGVPKNYREDIKKDLDNNFKYLGASFDTFSWDYLGKEIYFSWKKVKYGSFDLVWYGDKFVDYSLNELDVNNEIPKIYMGLHFNKTVKSNGDLDFSADIREKLLNKDNKSILNYLPDCFINLFGETYHYIGPFYNEKASNGEFTSLDCEEVVSTERKLIDHCDIFMCYFDDDVSAGVISELIYAATKGKKVCILYKNESDVIYKLKSSNWFPITFASQLLNNNIIIKEVNNYKDVLEYFSYKENKI